MRAASGSTAEALPPEQRPERMRALEARLDELLRIDSALVQAARADGQSVGHHPDSKPLHLLGVQVKVVASQRPSLTLWRGFCDRLAV
jgi:hypothetical protein